MQIADWNWINAQLKILHTYIFPLLAWSIGNIFLSARYEVAILTHIFAVQSFLICLYVLQCLLQIDRKLKIHTVDQSFKKPRKNYTDCHKEGSGRPNWRYRNFGILGRSTTATRASITFLHYSSIWSSPLWWNAWKVNTSLNKKPRSSLVISTMI